MKVKMLPTLATANRSEGGINTIVRKYHEHAPNYEIQFVDSGPFDVEIIHAASAPFTNPGGPNVSMNHGLYWENHQQISTYERRQNANIITNLRHARVVTTPSDWVAQAIRRGMRIDPVILPHGVDWGGWQHSHPSEGFILWAKNRPGDVCSPEPVNRLAARRPDLPFVTTFVLEPTPENIVVTGQLAYDNMKELMQKCSVYLATAPETWGISTVEAMAAGKPILGFNFGNNPEIVQHGVNGYLAEPGDWDDLANGLDYCLAHAQVLGENGREMARMYSWENAMKIVRSVCERAMFNPEPLASVVIPCYNKEHAIERAVRSALAQDLLEEVIVVNDGSTDNSEAIILSLVEEDDRVKYIKHENSGVAATRNKGVSESKSDFVVLLDGDDAIHPDYIRHTLPTLLADNSLGVVYTGLRWTNPDGSTDVPKWPAEYDFDAYMKGKPQVSTCALVRKEMWQRLGGQRDRYCKRMGAGSEDAEFWFRAGAYGVRFHKATDEPLFLYSSNSGITALPNYKEANWRGWHSFQESGRHHMASLATPERDSHPILARDQPMVSIIIPVGQGHVKHLVDALDSVDSQTYDNWEVIVVDDTGQPEQFDWYKKVFPHAIFIRTIGRTGAGAARNMGVQYAKAPLLYFLDADDWMRPDALRQLLQAYYNAGGNVAIYSDYFGVTKVSPEKYGQVTNKVVFYDEMTQRLVVEGRQPEYNCEAHQDQPTDPPYFWAIASSLIPKIYHYEIGGFDESLPTWEDCLYFVRLARHGKCFLHVPEMLYVYNLHRGQRREWGADLPVEKKTELLGIIKEKRGEEIMPCNCGGKSVANPRQPSRAGQPTDEGYVLAMYNPGRLGNHRVVGHDRHNYGYHNQGQVFPVRKSDVKAAPRKYVCPECHNMFDTINEAKGLVECSCQRQLVEETVVKTMTPLEVLSTPPPTAIRVEPDDLTVIPGIAEKVQGRLYEGGITTYRQLGQLTVNQFKRYGIVGRWPKDIAKWVQEHGHS